MLHYCAVHVTDVNCLRVLGIRGDWQNDLFSLTNKLAEHTKFSAYFLLSLVYQKHCNFASKTYTLVAFTNATKSYVLEAKLQCFFNVQYIDTCDRRRCNDVIWSVGTEASPPLEIHCPLYHHIRYHPWKYFAICTTTLNTSD